MEDPHRGENQKQSHRPQAEDTGIFYQTSGAALKLGLKTDVPTSPLCPGP